MPRVIWLVMDSFGLGCAPDADRFGDSGADTFGHIRAACDSHSRGPLTLPTLERLGLHHAHALAHGVTPPAGEPIGQWGFAVPRAAGKDTPSGHWESMGVALAAPFTCFDAEQDSFPAALVDAWIERAGIPGILGNCRGSGTRLIDRFGAEHLRSGRPILYTSADSVLQVAAHEHTFGLARLYDACAHARALADDYGIARVIARPFIGSADAGFVRTGNRRDFSLPPPGRTLFDRLCARGREVVSVGKISDIFAGRGITRGVPGYGHESLWQATTDALEQLAPGGLVATNFVEFDSAYGHRRDALGYAAALEAFDARLPAFMDRLAPDDLLVLSADHGCDPTWRGSDHTREAVPVIAFSHSLPGRSLGRRESFADIGAGMATHLGLAPRGGRCFLSERAPE